MIKTQFVPSIMIEPHKKRTYNLSRTHSDEVDGDQLAQDVEDVCNTFIQDGYEIVSITPVISGSNNYKNGVGFGYGFGYTSGVVVVAKK